MQRASSRTTAISLLLFGLAQPAAALEPEDVRKQLIGNFRYLIASQVDCAGDFESGSYICNKNIPGERRIQGSWDSYLYPVAVRIPYRFRFVDSNLFFTVQTLLPLFAIRFEDPELEQHRLDAIHAGMTAVNLWSPGTRILSAPKISSGGCSMPPVRQPAATLP